MIRELVLVSGDFTISPWFARGVPPMPRVPEGIAIRTLNSKDDVGLFTIGPVTQKEAALRLSEGDTCGVAIDSNGDLAAEMWCSEQPRFIEWIGCNIAPPKGHVHVFNAWVRPEFRGLGLQWNLAVEASKNVLSRGLTHMCAGVERREFPPFARKYAAMGLGLMAPYKSLWGVNILGMKAFISTRPPRRLDEACVKARAIFARRAEHV